MTYFLKEKQNNHQNTHPHVVRLCSKCDEPPEKILQMAFHLFLGLVVAQLLALVVTVERRRGLCHEVLAQLCGLIIGNLVVCSYIYVAALFPQSNIEFSKLLIKTKINLMIVTPVTHTYNPFISTGGPSYSRLWYPRFRLSAD